MRRDWGAIVFYAICAGLSGWLVALCWEWSAWWAGVWAFLTAFNLWGLVDLVRRPL